MHGESKAWFAAFVRQRRTGMVRLAYPLTLDQGRTEEVAPELGQAIRELLDPYLPPPDPFVGVARRVRICRVRRVRRIRRIAASMVAAASLAVAFAVASGLAPYGGMIVQPTVPADPAPLATGAQFADFGPGRPLGPAYVVARGAVHGQTYVVASTTFRMAGATCLFAEDAVFNRLSWCSSAWQRGQLGEWDSLGPVRADADVVAVGGTVEVNVHTVIIRTSDGREHALPAVRTPTSAHLAFFVGVLPTAGRRVAAVLATGPNGQLIRLSHAPAESGCPAGQPPDPDVVGDAMGCPTGRTWSVGRPS